MAPATRDCSTSDLISGLLSLSHCDQDVDVVVASELLLDLVRRLVRCLFDHVVQEIERASVLTLAQQRFELLDYPGALRLEERGCVRREHYDLNVGERLGLTMD